MQLLHRPTGIRVSCQETRSLQTNRMLARRQLLQKACTCKTTHLLAHSTNATVMSCSISYDVQLDQLYNPGLSKSELQRAKQLERERRRRKKAKKKVKKELEESTEI